MQRVGCAEGRVGVQRVGVQRAGFGSEGKVQRVGWGCIG